MLPEGKCRYIDGQIYPDGNFYVLDTQHIKHNGSELKSALNGINTDISNKVDKIAGKGLSTEDYTTAEKNKLSGIEANANDYVHPTTSGNKHIPSGGSSGKILGWSADGTAEWIDPPGGGGSVETVYIGATEYAPDANGKVTLPNYPTYSAATTSYDGLMSSFDKSALIQLVDGGAKQLLKFNDSTSGTLVATVQSNGYSVRITGGGSTGRTVSYASASIFKTGVYTLRLELSGTGASCYLNDETTSTQIKEYYESTIENINLTAGHIYTFKTYRKGANTDALISIMVCDKDLYNVSSSLVPYRPSYQELYERVLALENS